MVWYFAMPVDVFPTVQSTWLKYVRVIEKIAGFAINCDIESILNSFQYQIFD